jgi:hypothetical protein
VQFFIQVRAEADPTFDPNILRALSGQPHVRVHNGAMPREDYYDAIANSISLIAYEPESYRWRDSGVYHEAKLLDAPALVTAGTWMEDDVKALGNGLVIDAFTADAVVDCIMRAQRELRRSWPPRCAQAGTRVKRTASPAVSRCSRTRAQVARDLQKMLEPDRQIAEATSGCVMDRVGDRTATPTSETSLAWRYRGSTIRVGERSVWRAAPAAAPNLRPCR